MSDNKSRIKIKIYFGKIAAIMVAVFAVLLTVDLVLKHCEVKYEWNFNVIPKLIWVESGIKNFGAAFSFLSGTEWGKIFLIVLTFIMLILMIFAFLILPERFVILKLALAMISAGALGNLVDRLAFGYVRDFVWINMLFTEACCNFADFWIVFGIIIAIIDVLFLNEWAVIPLTKKAKEWAKELENMDEPIQPEEVEQPSQQLDPMPEELYENKVVNVAEDADDTENLKDNTNTDSEESNGQA